MEQPTLSQVQLEMMSSYMPSKSNDMESSVSSSPSGLKRPSHVKPGARARKSRTKGVQKSPLFISLCRCASTSCSVIVSTCAAASSMLTNIFNVDEPSRSSWALRIAGYQLETIKAASLVCGNSLTWAASSSSSLSSRGPHVAMSFGFQSLNDSRVSFVLLYFSCYQSVMSDMRGQNDSTHCRIRTINTSSSLSLSVEDASRGSILSNAAALARRGRRNSSTSASVACATSATAHHLSAAFQNCDACSACRARIVVRPSPRTKAVEIGTMSWRRSKSSNQLSASVSVAQSPL